eukprot:2462333-Prymnesium_polylepis.6
MMARGWPYAGQRNTRDAPTLPRSSGMRTQRKGWYAPCQGKARWRAACAIVPLYPNELTPPVDGQMLRSTVSCVGIMHPAMRSAPCKCEFSARSCAFATASDCCFSLCTTASKPTSPAVASV